jgi:hypothetical protein
VSGEGKVEDSAFSMVIEQWESARKDIAVLWE